MAIVFIHLILFLNQNKVHNKMSNSKFILYLQTIIKINNNLL